MAVLPRTAEPSLRLHRAVDDVTRRLATATASWGRRVEVDGAAVLAERARFRAVRPPGRRSQGGAARLLPSADGWAAVSLPRPTDLDLVPAWCGLLGVGGGGVGGGGAAWDDVAELVSVSTAADLTATAELLGIAVGVLGERAATPDGGVSRRRFGPRTGRARRTGRTGRTDRPLRVLDLSALWAGPLCAHLLGRAGAEVTKVESPDRPDGARLGDPRLHHLLNSTKRTDVVDLRSPAGRARLADLVSTTDVVVTASRRRALDALGLRPEEWLERPGGPSVWVSITGHGLASGRVGFGDDAAVAGGLVDHDEHGPVFLGDAVADPISGLLAATHAAEAVGTGRRTLLDVSMSGAAAAVAATP